MIKAILDRFEGDKVVVELENGQMRTLPRVWMEGSPVETDSLLIDEKNKRCWKDVQASHERKAHIETLMKDLFED